MSQTATIVRLDSIIPQRDLNAIAKERYTIKELRKTLKKMEDELDQDVQRIINALKTGATVAKGPRRAAIDYKKRRNVKWRQVVEREFGKDFAEAEIAATEPDVTEVLVID